MGNHYPLLIETTRPTLVKGMQYLNSAYTASYNGRHKAQGYLFQGRYKALVVGGDAAGYFLSISDYIHLNPARIKGGARVESLEELLENRWSSAGWLAGVHKRKPEWLQWEQVYAELGLRNWHSGERREYREYLGRRLGEVSGLEVGWRNIRRGWLLGSEGFVAQMKERLEELSTKPHERDSWVGVAVEEQEQDRAVRLLVEGTRWLAGQLGFESVGTLSYGLWHVEHRMATDQKTQQQWKLFDRYNPKD